MTYYRWINENQRGVPYMLALPKKIKLYPNELPFYFMLPFAPFFIRASMDEKFLAESEGLTAVFGPLVFIGGPLVVLMMMLLAYLRFKPVIKKNPEHIFTESKMVSEFSAVLSASSMITLGSAIGIGRYSPFLSGILIIINLFLFKEGVRYYYLSVQFLPQEELDLSETETKKKD